MDNKILLATDTSEFSEGAIREAINLSRSCEKSQLYAMSVVEINPELIALAPLVMEKMEQETRKHLEGIKERARKENVECEIITREGEEPYKLIVEEAGKKRAGLIVMGRRGRKGLMRMLMGSVTARVIGHADCNILIVPRAARIRYDNILVATDGSRYSNAAVSEAIRIAKRCGGNLIVVSVAASESISPLDIVHSQMQQGLIADKEIKEAENNIKKAKDLTGKEGVKAEGLVLSGRPYEAIVDTAKEKKADLIIVGSYGRTGIERLLMGSVTERVIGHAECAVLVVKAK